MVAIFLVIELVIFFYLTLAGRKTNSNAEKLFCLQKKSF